METVNCLRCGRKLRSAESIANRRGRRCRNLVQAAARTVALTDYKPAQIERAHEVIEQGGVVPTSRPNLWTAVSSDGTTTYLVALQGCTCPAGIKQRRCYHRAAATILTAAQPARRAA
ncbi:DUF6011 domain-containing protein [Nonomuraea sp. NPDC052265]|uniref:DUF6011 domain-containing protein n=1 Tax=Nonomuraea sp. NPDC052265 TaxID=3364374 RepID=UPI0037C9BCF1